MVVPSASTAADGDANEWTGFLYGAYVDANTDFTDGINAIIVLKGYASWADKHAGTDVKTLKLKNRDRIKVVSIGDGAAERPVTSLPHVDTCMLCFLICVGKLV